MASGIAYIYSLNHLRPDRPVPGVVPAGSTGRLLCLQAWVARYCRLPPLPAGNPIVLIHPRYHQSSAPLASTLNPGAFSLGSVVNRKLPLTTSGLCPVARTLISVETCCVCVPVPADVSVWERRVNV